MLEEINLVSRYDGTKNINIDFNQNKSMLIDTSGDVDLTDFVKELTLLIKDEVKINYIKSDCKEPKIIHIENTIEEIIKSFNQSINLTEADKDV